MLRNFCHGCKTAMPSCWRPTRLSNCGSSCILPTNVRLLLPVIWCILCSSLPRNGATTTKAYLLTNRPVCCKTICLLPSSVPPCSLIWLIHHRASTCSSGACKPNRIDKPLKNTPRVMPLPLTPNYLTPNCLTLKPHRCLGQSSPRL